MKSIKKSIALLLVAPLLLGVDIENRKYTVTSDIIACPTYLDNQTLTLTFDKASTGGLDLRVLAYNHKTDALTYVQTYHITLSPFTEQVLEVEIPLKDRINGSGLRIVFECTYRGETKTSSAVLYPYVKQSINIKNYRHEIYTHNNVLLKFENNIFYTDESFDFTNLNEYLSIEDTNILDLSNISFAYDEKLGFESGDIILHVKDYANVFPDLKKKDNEALFAMKKTVENGQVILSLDEELYVNKKTLEISRINHHKYVPTDNIYIPVGKELLFENDEIYITISDAGHSKCDITMPFTYYYTNKEIGQCYESDYCISGGIREWFLCSFLQ